MKKSRQTLRYVVSDFVTAAIVWLLFNLVRYKEVVQHDRGFDSIESFLLSDSVWLGQLLVPIGWLFLHYLSGYYNHPYGKSRVTEFFITLITVTIGVVIIFFSIVLNELFPSFQLYYELFFYLWGLQFFFTYLPRLWITVDGIRRISRHEWMVHVLVIGVGKRARQLSDDLYRLGYHVEAFIRESAADEVFVPADAIAGGLESLPSLMEQQSIEEIIVAIEASSSEQMIPLVYSLYRYKCPIKIWLDKGHLFSQVKIKTIHGTPLVDITANNFKDAECNIKLVFDKLMSIVALLALSPLFLYIAWRVKRDSKGPVFFQQERIGLHGKPFTIFKFRTMYTDAEAQGPLLSHENDRRITPFGQFMRKYRLDELPQFWNVLKGDMSLVGPRPERRYYIDQIVKQAPFYYLLHNVRPGITSLGMVKYGYAGSVEQMIKRLDYDIIYYENMSLALDIKILIYTIKTVITGKGI